MMRYTDTLLPLGEKGRDEGMVPPRIVAALKQPADATGCIDAWRELQSVKPLGQPLTPAPLPQGERGNE